MTTQNFLDMYGIEAGVQAGLIKKAMRVNAAYHAIKVIDQINRPFPDNLYYWEVLGKQGFSEAEMICALEILKKESEKVL